MMICIQRVRQSEREREKNCRLASGKHILHNEAFAVLNNLLLCFTNSSGSQNPAGVCVSVSVRLCVSEDVGKVNRKRRKQHPRNVATHDRRPSQDLRCLACDSRHKTSDSAKERGEERGERRGQRIWKEMKSRGGEEALIHAWSTQIGPWRVLRSAELKWKKNKSKNREQGNIFQQEKMDGGDIFQSSPCRWVKMKALKE